MGNIICDHEIRVKAKSIEESIDRIDKKIRKEYTKKCAFILFPCCMYKRILTL